MWFFVAFANSHVLVTIELLLSAIVSFLVIVRVVKVPHWDCHFCFSCYYHSYYHLHFFAVNVTSSFVVWPLLQFCHCFICYCCCHPYCCCCHCCHNYFNHHHSCSFFFIIIIVIVILAIVLVLVTDLVAGVKILLLLSSISLLSWPLSLSLLSGHYFDVFCLCCSCCYHLYCFYCCCHHFHF